MNSHQRKARRVLKITYEGPEAAQVLVNLGAPLVALPALPPIPNPLREEMEEEPQLTHQQEQLLRQLTHRNGVLKT